MLMVNKALLGTFIIGFMTNHFVETKFGTFVPASGLETIREKTVTPEEKKAFFCAQFQKLFSWTNIDKLLAINGSNLLNASGFTGFGI